MKSKALRLSLVIGILAALLSSTPVQNAQAAATDCTVSGGTICKVTFSFSGAYETFTVPSFISSVTLELAGAQGGSGLSAGGLGGYVTGTLSVTPGSNIFVYVGGQNGWNGGGAAGTGTNPGYVGGGASDIRIGGYGLADRKAVGGGGGGAGKSTCNSQAGGGGGYPGGFGGVGSNSKIGGTGTLTAGGSVTGSTASIGVCDSSTTGGGGGGQNGGGGTGGYGNAAGGTLGNCGAINNDASSGGGTSTVSGQSAGCFGIGGNGGNYATGAGGGGGGGWYGGGAGGSNWASGGGGGSSYLGAMTSTSYTNSTRAGNGYVTISYSNVTPTITLSTAGSTQRASKGQNLLLTSNINMSARVTFFADNKKIGGCVSIFSIAGNVTCTWKPTVQKAVRLTAVMSQNGTVIASSPSVLVAVGMRTGTR
jgi:hypothetical protein